MKIYYLYLVLVLVSISCDTSIKENETALSFKKNSQKKYDLPFNLSNSFDSAGQIHNEILTSYYAHYPLPTETDSIINLFHAKATSHPFFSTVTGSLILPHEFEMILKHPDTVLQDFLQSSALSEKAKISLSIYIEELLLYADSSDDYATIYDYITNYENTINTNTLYSSSEKAIILTITSITRHSVYMKKKRPKKNTDPDWNWLTTNIVAATAGANGDTQKAIYTALISGIIENK
jgi:hypothetical protein